LPSAKVRASRKPVGTRASNFTPRRRSRCGQSCRLPRWRPSTAWVEDQGRRRQPDAEREEADARRVRGERAQITGDVRRDQGEAEAKRHAEQAGRGERRDDQRDLLVPVLAALEFRRLAASRSRTPPIAPRSCNRRDCSPPQSRRPPVRRGAPPPTSRRSRGGAVTAVVPTSELALATMSPNDASKGCCRMRFIGLLVWSGVGAGVDHRPGADCGERRWKIWMLPLS